MKINWKSRMQNKTFWVSLIALLLVLANQIFSIFSVDITLYNDKITDVTESVLAVLGLLGIVVDNGTPGISDKED